MKIDIPLLDFLNWQTNSNHRIAIYCKEPIVSSVREADPLSEVCIIEDYVADDGRFTHRILWKDFYEKEKIAYREAQEFLSKPTGYWTERRKKKEGKRISVRSLLKDIENGFADDIFDL